MNKKLYSIKEATESSGLGIDVIKKFIKLKTIIPVEDNHKDININSYGITRLKMILKFLDKGFTKSDIIKELDKK